MAKLKIRIKRPLGEVMITRKVERDGASAIIWKEKGQRPEWKLHFNREAIYRTKRFPIGKMDTVDAFPYAENAVTYNYEAQEENQPIFDRETEDRFVRAKVLHTLGDEDKLKVHPLVWVIFIFTLLILVVNMIQWFNKVAGV